MGDFIGAMVVLIATIIVTLVNLLIAIIMIPAVIVAACIDFLRDLFTPARDSRTTINDADFVDVSNNEPHATPNDDFAKGLEAIRRGDYATALRKWKPLAEKGHVVAQTNLGVMYNKGHGVSQNYQEAAKWFRLAAEQGHESAQRRLGEMYFPRQGVENEPALDKGYKAFSRDDFDVALQELQPLAEQGNVEAQGILALIYMDKKGALKDNVKAFMWLVLSEINGPTGARKDLATLIAIQMTREQLERSKSLIKEWLVKNGKSLPPDIARLYEALEKEMPHS